MRLFVLMACAAVGLLSGCDQRSLPPNLGDGGSGFDPIAFFDGHVRSWGVMEGRSGAPTGWVVTDCEGHAEGPDRLKIVQRLLFQDAPAQERIWTLWRTAPGRFEATANDMVGTAKGRADGRLFHWTWILAHASGQTSIDVTMDQWMYRLDDGSVMIRTTVSKIGFILTEVTEQFTRRASGKAQEATAGPSFSLGIASDAPPT